MDVLKTALGVDQLPDSVGVLPLQQTRACRCLLHHTFNNQADAKVPVNRATSPSNNRASQWSSNDPLHSTQTAENQRVPATFQKAAYPRLCQNTQLALLWIVMTHLSRKQDLPRDEGVRSGARGLAL